MKEFIINWINYTWAYIFQREHIFRIVFTANIFNRFDRIKAVRNTAVILSIEQEGKVTLYSVIQEEKLLMK